MKKLLKQLFAPYKKPSIPNGYYQILIIWLSLMFLTTCALLNPKEVTDSFCQTYNPLIQNKGDAAIKAPKPVLDRMAANEKTYHQFCVSHTP